MKYINNILVLLLTSVIVVSCESDTDQTVITRNKLVFEENFDIDGAPDPDHWGYNIGTGMNGWGNNELQYYTDRSENVAVEGGVLKITAQQESFMGSRFTSARLLTKGKYQKKHGRIEARIKLPWGRGIWPAFWLLGDDSNGDVWPQIGEIDIMEYRGQEPTIIHGSVHGPGYSAGQAITQTYDLVNDRFDNDYHVFGIEWGPDAINYYVDDVLYNQITPNDVTGEWVFNDREFYIILNVAVGGTFVGSPDDATVFPQTMLVDYIRVYE